jgi:RND family efflux transporter MFP subunit
MESNGRLEAAKAELRMYQESLDKLEELLSRSHASQREIDRARAQRDMAEAKLKAIQEEMAIRSLEFERTRAQLEQRRVLAPIDGIVTKVYKDASEFVSPSDPTVVKIVQLDPLLTVFSVPVAEAGNLARNRTVRIEQDQRTIQGTIEFVSPVVDAQSGTVQVRVRIPNPGEAIPGGLTCRLLLPTAPEKLVKAPASR